MGNKLRRKCRRLRFSLSDYPITTSPVSVIDLDSSILALGSCFALEVQRWLKNKGYNIFWWDSVGVELIWYNTHTILAEFERAVGEWRQDDDDVWKLDDGKWQDPYRRCVFAPSKQKLIESIRQLDSAMCDAVQGANVLIVTLGLTEVWFQNNGRAICACPGYSGGGGQECNFVATDYEWNYNNVQRSIDLLRQVNPDADMILTVSPVPMFATFREMDQLVANTASKSILRAVADKVSQTNDNVHYFHSYELVVSELRTNVYKNDGRHVKSIYVDFIMKDFERLFVKERKA